MRSEHILDTTRNPLAKMQKLSKTTKSIGVQVIDRSVKSKLNNHSLKIKTKLLMPKRVIPITKQNLRLDSKQQDNLDFLKKRKENTGLKIAKY